MTRQEARQLLTECQRLEMPAKLRERVKQALATCRDIGRPRKIDRAKLAELLASGAKQAAAAKALGCSVSAIQLIVADERKRKDSKPC